MVFPRYAGVNRPTPDRDGWGVRISPLRGGEPLPRLPGISRKQYFPATRG